MSAGASFGAFAQAFAQGRQIKRDNAQREKTNEMNDRLLSIMERQPVASGIAPVDLGAIRGPASAGPVGANDAGGYGKPSAPAGGASQGGLFGLLEKYEGAGDYDTLYGHSQNDGGRFAGTKVSTMTLDQLDAFDKDYGAWVASRNDGTFATPAGFGQIVGTTRRSAAKAMGLPGDTVFSPEVQRAMVDHLAWGRIKGTSDPAARRAAVRQEWVGFKNAPDAEVDAAINEIVAKRQPVLGAIRS